jgi:hypothetical protein
MPTTEPAQSKFPNALSITGFVLLVPMLMLVIRIIWEETWLTLRMGPQMVGFSLAHGDFAPLLFAPIIAALWFAIALVTLLVLLVKRRSSWRRLVPPVALALILAGVLSIPAAFWQWVFVGSFATSPHAPDLMTYVAAQGYTRTVRGYLNHGVPVEARDYEGSTAAFAAAAGDHVATLQLLLSRGADLNAVNLYGDSPLEAAVENHASGAAEFLRQHGARQVKGSAAQREIATHTIVERSIRSMHTP